MAGDRIHKRTIIFDLDGTLIDSGFDLAHSLNFTLETFGLSRLPLHEITSEVGNGVSTIVKRALGPGGERRYPEAMDTFLRHYEAHMLDTTAPYPGVIETLNEHQGSFAFALLTNKPLYLTDVILEQFGLGRFFQVRLGGDTLKRKKPDPEGILRILSQTLTTEDEAVMVGDSINDVLAGRSSGVDVVGAGYGIGVADFRNHPPDHLIHSFPELFTLVHPL